MTALQAAVFAAELYSSAHPTAEMQLHRAADLLGPLAGSHGDLTVVFLEDRVTFGDRILPACKSLRDGIGRRIRQRGQDFLRINRGFQFSDAQFVATSLANDAPEDACLHSQGRYSFGVLALAPTKPETSTSTDSNDTNIEQQTDQLKNVWQTVSSGESESVQGIAGIVSDIQLALIGAQGVLPPLVTLKRFDEYTFVHTLNVAMLSAALGEAVGLNTQQTRDITIAALLHDVGKEAIPESILNKKGRFTEEEYRIVQNHPVDGARMLFNAGNVPDIAPIVAFEHHMHADGSGYPAFDRPRRTHLASRIVQVADVFDALRTVRPYRDAMPVDKIVGIMLEQRGTKLDAGLVDTFISTLVMSESPAA